MALLQGPPAPRSGLTVTSVPPRRPKYSRIGPYMILSNGNSGTLEERISTLRDGLRDEMRMRLRYHGIQPNMDMEIDIFFRAEQKAKAIFDRMKNHGIKDELKALFSATRKKEAVRIAGTLTMTQRDLVGLILNCADLGLRHHLFTKEFRPPGTEGLQPPVDMIAEGGKELTEAGKRFFKQMGHVFTQRQQIHVHLFENEAQHHFIFFDFADTKDEHWVGGNHVHYSSHLWGIPKEDTFKDFETRGERPTNVHIKFVEVQATEPPQPPPGRPAGG